VSEPDRPARPRHGPEAGFDGPSRTIIVEPLTAGTPAPDLAKATPGSILELPQQHGGLEMKKRLLVTTFAVAAFALCMAGPAAANKNTAVVIGECSNGESIPFRVNFNAGEHSRENAATPIVGGGSFKTTELHLFVEGVEVAFVKSNFPKESSLTCTGTGVEPRTETTFSFIVSGIARPGK